MGESQFPPNFSPASCVYQVAVNLTDEWKKLESSQTTGRMDVDAVSRPRNPALDQRVPSRNLPASVVPLFPGSEGDFQLGLPPRVDNPRAYLLTFTGIR